ncbi:MAG: extracellular solute-binding protein [Nocardioidaceae bacterium]
MQARRGRSARPRARWGALTAWVAALALTAACTGAGDLAPSPSPSPSASGGASTTAATGPVTLRFSVYGDRPVVSAYRALAQAYREQHPEVTVRVEAVPDALSQQGRLDRQFAGDEGPDVFLADSISLPELVGQGLVRPVDRLLEDRGVQFGDRYQRLGLEAFAAESALQCMPSSVSPQVVFYNKRLLIPSALVQPGEEAPTPETGWTWEQFVQAARVMSQDDVKGVYLAPLLTTLTPLLRSAGSDVVDDPQQPSTLTLADPDSREALELILDLARDRRVNLTPAEIERQDPVTRFERGRLGMFVGTRALVPRLREDPALRFDVFPLPSLGRFRTTAEVTGYCINDSSEVVDAAADFIAFASSDEGAEITARSGGVVPANLAALQSPAFVQPSQFPRNVDVFTTVIRRSEPMPNPPGWSDVVSQTAPLLQQLFYAPLVDLDSLLSRIDALSTGLLAGPTPTPASPDPTATPES